MFTTDSSSSSGSRDVGGERGGDGPVIHDEGFWADTTVTTDEDVWSRKGSGGSGGEAYGLLMEEEGERETWMEGVDVDPEAEAIFFGDKIPFPDLGKIRQLLSISTLMGFLMQSRNSKTHRYVPVPVIVSKGHKKKFDGSRLVKHRSDHFTSDSKSRLKASRHMKPSYELIRRARG